MINFVIVDNWTKNAVAELENFDLAEVITWAEENVESDWANIYYIEGGFTTLEAVCEDGTWYEPDGCTVLNY